MHTISFATIELCRYSMGATTDNVNNWDLLCSNKTLFMTPKFGVYVIFVHCKIFFYFLKNAVLLLMFFHPLKNVKTILGLQALQRQWARFDRLSFANSCFIETLSKVWSITRIAFLVNFILFLRTLQKLVSLFMYLLLSWNMIHNYSIRNKWF